MSVTNEMGVALLTEHYAQAVEQCLVLLIKRGDIANLGSLSTLDPVKTFTLIEDIMGVLDTRLKAGDKSRKVRVDCARIGAMLALICGHTALVDKDL